MVSPLIVRSSVKASGQVSNCDEKVWQGPVSGGASVALGGASVVLGFATQVLFDEQTRLPGQAPSSQGAPCGKVGLKHALNTPTMKATLTRPFYQDVEVGEEVWPVAV